MRPRMKKETTAVIKIMVKLKKYIASPVTDEAIQPALKRMWQIGTMRSTSGELFCFKHTL